MKINEDSLHIKYILGIEKDLPGYPTGFDVLHKQVDLCVRMPDRYKGSFTLHALKTYWFPEADEDHLLNSIDELIKLGLVEQTNDTEGKFAYKILQNPFE